MTRPFRYAMLATIICFQIGVVHAQAGALTAGDLKDLLSGRGMWVQHPTKTAAPQLAALSELGVRRLHVMASHAAEPYKDCSHASSPKLTANLAKLIELVKEGKAKGFGVIATFYISPSRPHIDKFVSSDGGPLVSLIEAGVDGVEYDLEGGWSRAAVCGYRTHEEAAKALYAATRALKAGMPVGVTTHLARAKDGHIARDDADWVSLQAYAKCQADNCVEFEDKSEGPGAREGRVPAELGSYPGLVVVGLAAFNQKWPNRPVKDAMRRSLNTINSLKEADSAYVGYSYWSATWALRDADVYEFLASSKK